MNESGGCFWVQAMAGTECAAWIQAWGSIGAILVAVLVGVFQLRHAAKVEAARRAEPLRWLETLLGEAASVAWKFLRAWDGPAPPTERYLLSLAERFEVAAKVIREMPLAAITNHAALEGILRAQAALPILLPTILSGTRLSDPEQMARLSMAQEELTAAENAVRGEAKRIEHA